MAGGYRSILMLIVAETACVQPPTRKRDNAPNDRDPDGVLNGVDSGDGI